MNIRVSKMCAKVTLTFTLYSHLDQSKREAVKLT